MHKHLGLPADKAATPGCDTFGPDGQPKYRYPDWGDRFSSPTEATIKCKREGIFLTGTASAFVSAVQGPWFPAPITAMVVGLFLFFPRFTLALARMSNRWPRLPR